MWKFFKQRYLNMTTKNLFQYVGRADAPKDIQGWKKRIIDQVSKLVNVLFCSLVGSSMDVELWSDF